MYPIYGPGTVTDISLEEVGDKSLNYCHIEFKNTNLSVAVPMDKFADFGIRTLSSKATVKDALKELDRQFRIKDSELEAIELEIDLKMKSGSLTDAAWVIAFLKSLSKKRAKEDKKLNSFQQDTLEKAENFLKLEVEMVLGKRAADKL